MNYWTKRSIKLSSSSNYLDRLFEVYPVSEGENRPLSSSKKEAILKAISAKDKKRAYFAVHFRRSFAHKGQLYRIYQKR